MKKNSLFLVLFFICLSGFSQWSIVGSGPVSSNWTVYNDIKTDTSGRPVTVFYDNWIYKASCLRFVGDQWVQMGSSTFDSFPIDVIIDFEIDKKNNYYMLFRDADNYQLSCIMFDGNSWTYAGSKYITTELTVGQSLAVDTAGVLYASFYAQSGFKILKESGGSWQPVTTVGLSATNLSDLQFDNNNVAFLAYVGSSGRMNCAKLLNSNWVPAGNGDFSGLLPYQPLLHITQNNQVYVGFDNPYINCFKLDVQTNAWIPVGSEGLGVSLGGIEDLDSGADSKIYISTSSIGGDKARCFSFDGTDWIQLGASGISESYAYYPSIAFNKYGNLFAAYNDYNTGKAMVKEYSFATGYDIPHSADPVKIYPNPAQTLFAIEMDGHIFDVLIYSLHGQKVFVTPDCIDKVEINTQAMGRGIYIVIVKLGDGTSFFNKLVVL